MENRSGVPGILFGWLENASIPLTKIDKNENKSIEPGEVVTSVLNHFKKFSDKWKKEIQDPKAFAKDLMSQGDAFEKNAQELAQQEKKSGTKEYSAKDYRVFAQRTYELAVKLDETNPTARFKLAESLYRNADSSNRKENHKAARIHLEAAIRHETDPQALIAIVSLIREYDAKGFDKKNPDPSTAVGSRLFQLKKFPEAKAVYHGAWVRATHVAQTAESMNDKAQSDRWSDVAKNYLEKSQIAEEHIPNAQGKKPFKNSISGDEKHVHRLLIEMRALGVPLAALDPGPPGSDGRRNITSKVVLAYIEKAVKAGDPRVLQALGSAEVLPKEWLSKGQIKPEILQKFKEHGFALTVADYCAAKAKRLAGPQGTGNPDKVLYYLKAAVEFDDTNSARYRAVGDFEMKVKDYSKAVVAYKYAVKANPQDAAAQTALVNAYEANGDWDKTSKNLPVDKIEIILNEKLGQAHALMDAGDLDGAKRNYLAKARAVLRATRQSLLDTYGEPNKIPPQMLIPYIRAKTQHKLADGRVFSLENKQEKTIESYQEAEKFSSLWIHYEPNNPQAYLARAQAKHNLMDYQGAMADYTTAAPLSSEGAQALKEYPAKLESLAANYSIQWQQAKADNHLPLTALYLTEEIKIHEALGQNEMVEKLSAELAPIAKQISQVDQAAQLQEMADKGFLTPQALQKDYVAPETRKNAETYLKFSTAEGGGLKVELTPAYYELKPEEQTAFIEQLQPVTVHELYQANIDNEKDPAKKLYYEAQVEFLEGKFPAAKLKLIEVKAKTEGTKDPELLQMREDACSKLRDFTIAHIDKLEKVNEALKTKRDNTLGIITDPYAANRDLIEALRWLVKNGKADTFDEAVAFLRSEQKRMHEDFANDPVIKKRMYVTFPYQENRWETYEIEKDLRHKSRELDVLYQQNPDDPRLKDPNAFPDFKIFRLAGGTLEAHHPFYGETDPAIIRVVVGKEGGTIVTGAARGRYGSIRGSIGYESNVYYFPPSDEERVVLIYPQHNHVATGNLKHNKDYQSGHGRDMGTKYLDPLPESGAYLIGHPEAFDGTIQHLDALSSRDSEFNAFFKMETGSALEEMKTPQGRQNYLLGVADEVHSRWGSYTLGREVYEGIFSDELSLAISLIPENEIKDIQNEVEKDQFKILESSEKKVRQEIEKLKKDPEKFAKAFPNGEPSEKEILEKAKILTDMEMSQRMDNKIKKKAYYRLQEWSEQATAFAVHQAFHKDQPLAPDLQEKLKTNPFFKNGKIDPEKTKVLKAWSEWVDSTDFFDQWDNWSSETWESVVDEIAITVVTMPITMGAGSAIRGGLGATKWAVRGVAGGGIRAFATRATIFMAGNVAEGLLQELLTHTAFSGDFSLKNVGFNIVMSGAFHGGGKVAGRALKGVGADDAAIALARSQGKRVIGKRILNLGATLETQALIATTMSYASEIILDHDDPRSFWTRMGGESLRMVAYHYGTHAINMATGQLFIEGERRAQVKQTIAEEEFGRLTKKGVHKDEALKLAEEYADREVPAAFSGVKPDEIMQKHHLKRISHLVEDMGVNPTSPDGQLLTMIFLESGQGPDKLQKGMTKPDEVGNLKDWVKNTLKLDPESPGGKKALAVTAQVLAKQGKNPTLAKEFPELAKHVAKMRESTEALIRKAGLKPGKETDTLVSALLSDAFLKGRNAEEMTQLADYVSSDRNQRILKDTVDVFGKIGGKPFSETAPGRALMGKALHEVLSGTGNPKEFAANLANYQVKVAEKATPAEQLLWLNHLQGDAGLKAMAIFVTADGKSLEDLSTLTGQVLEGKVALTIDEHGLLKENPIPENQQAARQKAILNDLPMETLSALNESHGHLENVPWKEQFADRIVRRAGMDPSSPEYAKHQDAVVEFLKGVEGTSDFDGDIRVAADHLTEQINSGVPVTITDAQGNSLILRHPLGGSHLEGTAKWKDAQLIDLGQAMGFTLEFAGLKAVRTAIQGRDPQHPFKLSEAKAALHRLHEAFQSADQRGDFEGKGAKEKKLIQVTLFNKVIRGELTLAEAKKLAHDWSQGKVRLEPNANKVVTDKGSRTIGYDVVPVEGGRGQDAARGGIAAEDPTVRPLSKDTNKTGEKTGDTEPTRPPDKGDTTPTAADLRARDSQTPPDYAQIMGQANAAVKKYSLKHDSENWGAPRHQLEFFAGAEMKGSPLGEKAQAAKEAGEKIPKLRGEIEALIQKKAELADPTSADEKKLNEALQAKQAQLETELGVMAAYETAFEHANRVRDGALSGFLVLQENVFLPLIGDAVSTAGQGPDAMSGVKDHVLDVQIDHPDSVENFSEYQKGEPSSAGSLTIVVRDAESIPKVLEAAEQAMAADRPAAQKRSVLRAASHLVREKVMAKQKELAGTGKKLDNDALWNRFDRAAADVLAALPENPTPDQVEQAVGDIARRSVEGAKIETTELSGIEGQELEFVRVSEDANLQFATEDVRKHLPEAIPPKPIAKGDDRIVFSSVGPDGQAILMEVRVTVAAPKGKAKLPKAQTAVSPTPDKSPSVSQPLNVTWNTKEGGPKEGMLRLGESPDLPGIRLIDDSGTVRVPGGIVLPDGSYTGSGETLKAGTTLPKGTEILETIPTHDGGVIPKGILLSELKIEVDTKIPYGEIRPDSAEFFLKAHDGQHKYQLNGGKEEVLREGQSLPLEDGDRLRLDGVLLEYNQGILTRPTAAGWKGPAIKNSIRELYRSQLMSVERLIDLFGKKAVDEFLTSEKGGLAHRGKVDFVLEATAEIPPPENPKVTRFNAPFRRDANGIVIPPVVPESALVMGKDALEQNYDHGGVAGGTFKGEGYKGHNEDRVLITPNGVMVLDGMGGHAGGERAAAVPLTVIEWALRNGAKIDESLAMSDQVLVQENKRAGLADSQGRPDFRAPGSVAAGYSLSPTPNPDGTYRAQLVRVGDAAVMVYRPTPQPDGTVNYELVHLHSRMGKPELEFLMRHNADPGQALGGHYEVAFDPATGRQERSDKLDVSVTEVDLRSGDIVITATDGFLNNVQMDKNFRNDDISRMLSATAKTTVDGKRQALMIETLTRMNLLEARRHSKETNWELTPERFERAYRKAYSHVTGTMPSDIPLPHYVSGQDGKRLELDRNGDVFEWNRPGDRMKTDWVVAHFKNDNVTVTVQEVGQPTNFTDASIKPAADLPQAVGLEPTAELPAPLLEPQRGPSADEPTADLPLAPGNVYPSKDAAQADRNTTARPHVPPGPVEGIVGAEVISKIAPRGIQADLSLKVKSPTEVIEALKAKNKDGKIKPDDLVMVHFETFGKNNFVLIETYGRLTNPNFIAAVMMGKHRGAELQINYIVEKNPDTKHTTIHLDFIGVNTARSGQKGIGKKMFENWLSHVAKAHPEATKLTAHAVNIRIAGFFSKYLKGARSIQTAEGNRFEHPIDGPISEELIQNLAQTGALTQDQSAGLLQAKKNNSLDRFQLHDQLFGYLEHNRKEAVIGGKSKAKTDVEFLVEHIDKNRKLFAGSDIWGDLWVEGTIPPRASSLRPQINRVNEVDTRVRMAQTLIAQHEAEHTQPGESYNRALDNHEMKAARAYVEAVGKGDPPPSDLSFLNALGSFPVKTQEKKFPSGGILLFGHDPGESPLVGMGGTFKEFRGGFIVLEGAKRTNHKGQVVEMGEVLIPAGSDHPFVKGDWLQYIPPIAGGSDDPHPPRRVTQERAALPPAPAALVPVHFYDVKKLDLSQGSQILESKDPGNPWKVKLEYVRGGDGQAAVKITPLGGAVEIKAPGDSDYGPIDPAKTYSLLDDPHLRLGGGEYFFGAMPNAFMGQGYIPLEGHVDGGIRYYEKGQEKADLARLAALDQLPAGDPSALKNPDEPGISSQEKKNRDEILRWHQAAKEFKEKHGLLSEKYGRYLKAVENYETKKDSGPDARKRMEALWQEVMTDFVALTQTDYYQMEAKYHEVSKKMEGHLQALDLIFVDEETQAATKAKASGEDIPSFAYGYFKFIAPDQLGMERMDSLLTQPQMARGLVSIDLQAERWNTIEQILTRIHGEDHLKVLPKPGTTPRTPIAQRWLEMAPDGKTATAKVRVESGDYQFEVELRITVNEAVEAAPRKEIPEAAQADRDTSSRPSGKQKLQAPELPEIRIRVSKQDIPLAAGEGLKLIEQINHSSATSQEKVDALLALAHREDFKDFAALQRELEKTRADSNQVKKARAEVDKIIQKRATEGTKKAPVPAPAPAGEPKIAGEVMHPVALDGMGQGWNAVLHDPAVPISPSDRNSGWKVINIITDAQGEGLEILSPSGTHRILRGSPEHPLPESFKTRAGIDYNAVIDLVPPPEPKIQVDDLIPFSVSDLLKPF